jgi:hypothetical protein
MTKVYWQRIAESGRGGFVAAPRPPADAFVRGAKTQRRVAPGRFGEGDTAAACFELQWGSRAREALTPLWDAQ